MSKSVKREAFFKKMSKAAWWEKEICGEPFLFRRRTMKEIQEFLNSCTQDKDQNVKLIGEFIIENVCDENKQPVFNLEDIDLMPENVFSDLCNTLFEANGLGKMFVENEIKN